MVEIHGECTSGFTPVREAFAANFAEGRELGAAVCVYRDGRPVVNLWAGDTGPGGAPWRSGTIAPIASATKGMVAAAAMILVDRGQLDLDAPVAAYWPEFAAEGKDRIPVRWVLGHRSGVVAFDPPLTIDDIERGTPVADALAAARPVWEPGRGHGYHSLTMGWLVGEIVRRVTGLSVGRFFAKEVASPLGLDLHLGLPAYEEENLATLVWPTPQQVAAGRRDPAFAELNSALRDPSSLLYRSTYGSVELTDGILEDVRVFRAEVPSCGGVGNAESLARMYAALIGEVDGVRLVRPETADRARAVESRGLDLVLRCHTCYGRGFMLPGGPMWPDPGMPAAFGHPGATGAFAYADPDTRLAFAYVPNRMSELIEGGDDRVLRLMRAAHACATALPAPG